MIRKIASIGVLLVLLTACATAPRQSLYDSLGQRRGIETLVETLLEKIAEDPRIAHQFADVDIVNLHLRLVEQICVESGGPCVYGGRSMAESHAGLTIREADFNALVEDLILAMDQHGIARSAQNRLLRRLAPMQPDIVTP